MNNIFNIKSFPSDDEGSSVSGLNSPHSIPSIGRPHKPVHHDKPFEKYLDEPKEGKGDHGKETLESPLLAKMGKAPAEMEEMGNKSAVPLPSPFPAKEVKTPPVHSDAFSETEKSASSLNAALKAPSLYTETEEGFVGEEELASISHKKKSPDEVVWGATNASNKPIGDALDGEAQKPVAAVEVNPKVRAERVLNKDPDERTVEESNSFKKVEEVPVFGATVNLANVVTPHHHVNAIEGIGAVEVKVQPAASTSATLKSLVEEIVSHVDTLTKGERMESVITLKPSPTLPSGFENATIRLTSVASARGEVNITFGGLTQSAVQLVQSNQADLLNALSTKGVTVHIFSASTQQDPIAAQASSSNNQQQQQHSSGGSPQEQRRQQQNQEEGEYT